VDLGELAAVACDLLAGRTLTRPRLRDLLAERWPGRDAEALAWSVQCLLCIVHPPPSGTWGVGGATPFALAHEWIGRPVVTDPEPVPLVRRYLAAFGPATVKDVQTWSGLTRLRDVVERMRPELRTFRDEAGPSCSTWWTRRCRTRTPRRRRGSCLSSTIVAHTDRRRLMTDADRKRTCVGSLVAPTFLIDGRVAGSWKLQRDRETATLVIAPYRSLGEADRTALEEEGAGCSGLPRPPAGRCT
jgi:hypothetical protein